MKTTQTLIAVLIALLLSTPAEAVRGDAAPIISNPIIEVLFDMGTYSSSGELCAEVDSTCSDLWLVIYDDCMGQAMSLDIPNGDQDECFAEADYAYDECMYGAGC